MKRLAEYDIPTGDEQFPLEFMETRGAIRLGESSGRLTVGLVDLADHGLRSDLEFFLRRPLEWVAVAREDLSEYLGKQGLSGKTVDSDRGRDRNELDRLANDAPIVNLVNSLFLEGIRRGCSDIHIESLPTEVRVRYRIDGVLESGRVFSKDLHAGVSSRIKVMANLDIIERRLPQDGRLTVNVGGRDVEFRVSIVPLADGESIVLRLFHRIGTSTGLEGLGFHESFLTDLRKVGQTANGLILVTGPTGSGKTTTLNVLIRELAQPHNKVITIEDPVENVLDGVNQIQTNEAIGLTFDSILRRLLRQDPDILMVGEIRDKKTAELAMRSALTGHLVLSTLHTNDALAAIPRLHNMGVEPYLLGAVLRATAAQRLVRRLCQNCRQPTVPTESQKAFLSRWKAQDSPLWAAAGCPDCGGTGYKGRTVIGEIYLMDETTEEMIVAGRKRLDFAEHFAGLESRTLWADGLEKVAQGITSLVELERAVSQR